jgi:hypothetical protein
MTPNHDQSDFPGPQSHPRLGDALKREAALHSAPSELDALMAELVAGGETAGRRGPRRLRWLASAAAVLLVAGLVSLFVWPNLLSRSPRSAAILTMDTTSNPHDWNRDGQVDVLDVYVLAGGIDRRNEQDTDRAAQLMAQIVRLPIVGAGS